jgi:PAS domain S-box-containing protein
LENTRDPFAFLKGGGEMGERIRNFNWAATPVGPMEHWPQNLRTTLSLMMSTKFPMFLFWGKDLIQFYNDGYIKILTYQDRHPSALGQTAPECWDDVWPVLDPMITSVQSGKDVYMEDLMINHRHHGERMDTYWTFSYSPVWDDEGGVSGVVVICNETTETVKTINHLNDSKQELEFAIEAAELGIWDLNPATGQFTGNTRLKKWFGLAAEDEIPLVHATSVIDEKDRDRVNKAILQAMDYEGNGRYDEEYTINNPVTNTAITVRAQGRAWFGKDKKAYRFNGTLQDITSRRSAQREIDEANQLATLATKSSGIGLFQVELATGKIEYNPEFSGIITGNTHSELAHRSDYVTYIHKDDLAIRDRALKEGERTNEYLFSVRTIWDDGSVHYVTVTGAKIFDENGKAVSFSGTVKDITAQELQKLELKRSEERFKGMIAQAPIGVCLFTGEDLVVEVANDIMLGYWGKDASIIGKPFLEALPEMTGQPFPKMLTDIYNTGVAQGGTAVPAILEHEGVLETFYYDFTYKPLFADDGTVYGVMNMASDVTERVKIQQRIDESQQQILASFEESPVGIALIDEENLTFTMVNPFYGELVGRPVNDILGKPLLEALPELEGQGIEELLFDVFDTGKSFTAKEFGVTLMRNNKLQEIFVDLTYQPRLNSDDEVTGVLVVATDVTEQVRSRRRVEASEAKLRSIIATAPAGMGLFVGRDLVVDTPNQTFIDIVGKGWDIVGKPLREAMPELLSEGQPFLQILDDVYTSGKMFQSYGSLVQIVQNGVLNNNYYNITYTPLFDENNEVFAILDIAIDVTETVIARQKLENAQASLRGAIELAELANWSYDIKNDVYNYSQRFVDWLGFDENSKNRDVAYNPLPLEYREKVDEAIRASFAEGSDGIYDFEHPIINQISGQVRIIHAQAQVFYDTNGEPEFLTGVAQDVTKDRRLQQQLEFQVQNRTEELQAINEELETANNQLINSNKELQQFAYIASHDLQEPSRKISIFANMLKDRLTDIDTKSAYYLDKIGTSSERMGNLIRDVLGYSQLSKEFTFVPVNLSKIIEDITDEFELLLEQHSAQVHYDGMPFVDAIPLQMSQLFGNLISNSIKYSRPDVPPMIDISAEVIDRKRAENYLEKNNFRATEYYKIVYTDNGIGFDQKYADKIFNIFQRLHTKDEYTGTGIGLAMCKKILQNHHGNILADSAINHGAIFTIVIPVKQESYGPMQAL